MQLFAKLLLAHLLGDFILQPTKWVIHKEAKKAASKYLYFHALIHFGLYMLVLWNIHEWKIALVLALGHLVIDMGKLYVNPMFKNKNLPFFLDQFLHLLVIYICCYYTNLYDHTLSMVQNLDWALIAAIVFVTSPAAIIMSHLLEGMSNKINTDHKSLPNAGKYIGIIERLFVLTFILIGRWEAIGLLITAKSVFRFNDLKESNSRKLTEYILIGTLVSFGLAIVAGLVYVNFN